MLTLLPGAARASVVNALDECVNKLNAVPGSDKFTRFNAYLSWANEAAGRLGRLVSSRDVDRLLLTRRHWVLQGIDPAANDAVTGLLSLEMDERRRELLAERDSLQHEGQRWEPAGHIVIADTNVFLHHPSPFDRLPWREMSGAHPMVALHVVVPLIIVDELDAAKISGKSGIRTRARTTLRDLDDLLESPEWVATLHPSAHLQKQVTLRLVMDPEHHRRLEDADSELVDRARALADFATQPLTLVTYDTGMAFRARTAGLTVNKLRHEKSAG